MFASNTHFKRGTKKRETHPQGPQASAFAQVTVAVCLLLALCAGAATGATWQMKQRDMHNTGRADYAVPEERLNDTFFSVFSWQKPSPNSPDYGSFSCTSMPFCDHAGPEETDIVIGGYHWPKGVQGMDRHTGACFWYGNPCGGETIARTTPAFSNDGTTVYVVNDATESGEYPNGHPLMAFLATDGPSSYWHNGNDPNPNHLSAGSPTVAADGRIFQHEWVDRPYAGSDNGSAISEVWAAATHAECCWSDPTLYDDEGDLRVVIGSRWHAVHCYDGATGAELWAAAVDEMVDASVTIDPDNGNIYVGAGDESIYIVGLDKDGNPLWGSASLLVYEHIPGTNNPQRAQATGCLSFDGATYYFQTNSQQGDGSLYAINTSDGSVKWEFATGSLGWEIGSSSPIVTTNGLVIVGNNLGDVYYAILDEGAQGTLMDTYAVNPDDHPDFGHAVASATLSPEGDLYLPLRTYWIVSNGDGDIPSADVANVFSAFDLRADAVVNLPPPPWQAPFALNNSVLVTWQQVPDPGEAFDHYAIYRDTEEFLSIAGMTPIATVDVIDVTSYLDETAVNGTGYYYAVTTVTLQGAEQESVASIGPRTPWDETDLQVVSMARTPRYPRYDVIYTVYEITEPSGFGPYFCSAATGLGGGQNENTQRWPELGDPITYTATVRNRGSNPWSGAIDATWTVDGSPMSQPSDPVSLEPNDTVTFDFVYNWDGASHEIGFSFDLVDARPENNALTIDTKSVAFLSYIDRSRMEEFREETGDYPLAATDDFIDWLNRHMQHFNQMFADAGCEKRVHFDVLEVLNDYDANPGVDRILWAIFPFRYYHGEGSLRLSGYYSPEDDLDYGLLHEMGHQLGLIDIYQINTGPDQNWVSHEGYSGPQCLMNGVSHFLSEHSANAMTHWLDAAHGYFGQYLYCMPEFIKMRFLGIGDEPLEGATVTIYQKVERPGIGPVITDQIKAQGVTDEHGEWVLPNVAIDPEMVPPTYAGDELHDNPFGYVHVIGNGGLLLFEVQHEGFVDYTWLDITEVNNAYWAGETGTAVFERDVPLGGEIQYLPPTDMAELNAASWVPWADGGTATITDDTDLKVVGEGSIRFDTDGGFDNYARYPGDCVARWNLSNRIAIHLWCYAVNENLGFQEHSPWIRLHGPEGFIQYRPTYDILNEAIEQWVEFVIPMEGDDTWIRSDNGTVSLSEINSIEIHADTWGYGFSLWLDGVGFEYDPADVDKQVALPACLALSQNAPNPFRQSTEIRFDLPNTADVRLEVFDISGRLVTTLLSDRLAAGVHRLAWDGRDASGRRVADGIYFSRLRAQEQSLERKIVLH